MLAVISGLNVQVPLTAPRQKEFVFVVKLAVGSGLNVQDTTIGTYAEMICLCCNVGSGFWFNCAGSHNRHLCKEDLSLL